MKLRKSSKRVKSKSQVDWLDLPRDLTIKIFIKLGTAELLRSAQRVCSSWRSIAKDPQLYRVVHLYNSRTYFQLHVLDSIERTAKLAIDRSRGQLVEFSIEYFCSEAVLCQLAEKAPGLKCLRMANCSHGYGHGDAYSDECLVEVIEKLPLLEEIEFILVPTFDAVSLLKSVGRSCPKLRSFRLNGKGEKLPPGLWEWASSEAFAIADNMNPALRSLHLLGNSMKNDGLEAILERFTQLEYLDLRRCANLDLKGDLLKKCRGVKTLMLPDDSVEDYRFPLDEPKHMLHDYPARPEFGFFGWRGCCVLI